MGGWANGRMGEWANGRILSQLVLVASQAHKWWLPAASALLPFSRSPGCASAPSVPRDAFANGRAAAHNRW
jgi:hypothetical protein